MSNVRTGSEVRNTIAFAVWALGVLAAIVLAVGALCVALGAHGHDPMADGVINAARAIDGPFWKMFDFHKTLSNGMVAPDWAKNAVVNWGLAAVAYLVAGRIADRLIRP